MKTILLLLSLILSAQAFPCANTLPLSEVQKAIALEPGAGSQSCAQLSQEQCLCFDGITWEAAELQDELIPGEPAYFKEQIESCSDELDCQAKHEAKVCESEGFSSIKNLDLMEVYCSKANLIPSGNKKLVNNPTKLATFQAQQIAKAQMAAALLAAKKLRECGTQVLDLVLVRNAAKQLNTTQIKAMVGIYAPIKSLLETGSLNSAKEEVQAVEPDGTLVTAEDKTAVIAAIDACLGG